MFCVFQKGSGREVEENKKETERESREVGLGGSYFVLKDRSSRDVSGSLRIPRRFADIPGQQSFVLIKQESDGTTVKGKSQSYDSTRAVRQDFGNVRGTVGGQMQDNLFVVIWAKL